MGLLPQAKVTLQSARFGKLQITLSSRLVVRACHGLFEAAEHKDVPNIAISLHCGNGFDPFNGANGLSLPPLLKSFVRL
jgi:hypothetical protein